MIKCTDEKCFMPDKNYTCFRNPQGQLHREDGPALIYDNGTQHWFQNGKRHREDGPSRIWPDGIQYWYLNNQKVT